MAISSISGNGFSAYSISSKNGSDQTAITSQTSPTNSLNKDHTDITEKKSGITEKKKDGTDFTEQELKQIKSLKSRDIEVKAHEQAHIAAGGQYVRSGAHYQYQTGPDGNRYAVGGEVDIDVSKIQGDLQGTIVKMEAVIRSALAPAEPSGQDRSVAAQAQKIETEARMELLQSQSNKLSPKDKTNKDGTQETEDKKQENSHISIYV